MKLKADSHGRNVSSSTPCHHQDIPSTSDVNNNSSNAVELNQLVTSQHDEIDRIQPNAPSCVDQSAAVATIYSTDSDELGGITSTESSSATEMTVRQDVGTVDDVDSSCLTQLTENQPRFRRSHGLDVDRTRDSMRRKQRRTVAGDEGGRQITDPILLQALQTSPFAKHLNLLSPQVIC